MMPTDAQPIDALLDELERLEKAAETPTPQDFPGPVEINLTFDRDYIVYPPAAGNGEYQVGGPTAVFSHPGDVGLYVSLRNAAPHLLAIARAANELLDRLDAVHADERYKSVWISYMIHGGKYTEPTYKFAMDRLRAALDAR